MLKGADAERVLHLLKQDAELSYLHYEEMLNADEEGVIRDESRPGLARELARMNLTLNYYTQWYWKIDLHNLLHFLALRADAHAQYEIRVYAEVMLDMVKRWLPLTYAAFENYRVGGVTISAKGLKAIKNMLSGQSVTQESSGMSKGEWRELMDVLERG